MMKRAIGLLGIFGLLPLRAEDVAVSLPEVTVYSPRVANQSPVGTFAMPVSALRWGRSRSRQQGAR